MTLVQIPQNFDLRSLQVFVTTAEQGGMTQSAKALSMTQSGVSQTIAALEDAIGARLFDRSVRPIVLTAAGRMLFARGQKLLSDTREAYIEACEADKKKLSMLTIGMPESMANLLSPKLFKSKKEACEYWRIWSGLTPAQIEAFQSHAIDIIITEDSVASELTEVERYSIISEPFFLIFPKSYEGSTELGPHLNELDFLRYSLRSALGRQTETQLNRMRLRFPQVIEFDNSRGLTEAVASGLGWGITTPLCILQSRELIPQLKTAPIKRGSFYRHFSLITRQNSLGSMASEIAAECQKILQNDVLPPLFNDIPWLEDMLLCRTTKQIYRREM